MYVELEERDSEKEKVARWISDEEFGVVSRYSLPEGFSMVKEETLADGSKTYVETCFKRYNEEEHYKKGFDRYVLSGELFLTIRMCLKEYFVGGNCCWMVALQRRGGKYEFLFKKDKNGMYNEFYGNYVYVKNLCESELEAMKVATRIPEPKFKMITGSGCKRHKNM